MPVASASQSRPSAGEPAGPTMPDVVGALVAACFPQSPPRPTCRLRAVGSRSTVWALEWEEPGGQRHALVAKCPNRRDQASLAGLEREALTLTFLGRLPDPELALIAPKLYGHDPTAGVLLMEDLELSRGARRLEDVLQTSPAEVGVTHLRALARVLGRLHRATFGRLTYESVAAAFARAFELRLQAFAARMQAYGLRVDAQAVAELQQIRGLLERREEISFCHGDVSPANVYAGPRGVALCDFEFAGPRHPILEGIPAGAPFPFTVDAGALSGEVTADLEATYRRECDLAALCQATGVERLRRAAQVWFVVYHWANSAPHAGVPVGFAGGRAKTLDLTRLLEGGATGAPFGAVTKLLLAAGERLLAENALAPDTSLPYACFDPRAARPPEVDAPGSGDAPPPAAILGLFRVNRHCHLVIQRLAGDSVGVFLLERPDVQCTARRVGALEFEANEMLLRLRVEAGGLRVRDLRTGKSVAVTRVRWPWILLRRWRERLVIMNVCRRRTGRRPWELPRIAAVGRGSMGT